MAVPHDEEHGGMGDSAGSSYGAAQRGGVHAPAQSRAWALGAVVLTCALVVMLQWAANPVIATEMIQRGRKVWVCTLIDTCRRRNASSACGHVCVLKEEVDVSDLVHEPNSYDLS